MRSNSGGMLPPMPTRPLPLRSGTPLANGAGCRVWRSTPTPVCFANHHSGASQESRPSFGPPFNGGEEMPSASLAPFLSPFEGERCRPRTCSGGGGVGVGRGICDCPTTRRGSAEHEGRDRLGVQGRAGNNSTTRKAAGNGGRAGRPDMQRRSKLFTSRLQHPRRCVARLPASQFSTQVSAQFDTAQRGLLETFFTVSRATVMKLHSATLMSGRSSTTFFWNSR